MVAVKLRHELIMLTIGRTVLLATFVVFIEIPDISSLVFFDTVRKLG